LVPFYQLEIPRKLSALMGTICSNLTTSKAAAIRDGFEKMEQQANPLPNLCASPADPLCTTLAAAYVPANRSAVMFCQSFFSYSPHSETYIFSSTSLLTYTLTSKIEATETSGYFLTFHRIRR
jgi:hypothetical protein